MAPVRFSGRQLDGQEIAAAGANEHDTAHNNGSGCKTSGTGKPCPACLAAACLDGMDAASRIGRNDESIGKGRRVQECRRSPIAPQWLALSGRQGIQIALMRAKKNLAIGDGRLDGTAQALAFQVVGPGDVQRQRNLFRHQPRMYCVAAHRRPVGRRRTTPQ